MLHSSVIPMVVDSHGHHERTYDIYSLLLKERIIFLGSAINDQVANLIVAQMLYLNSQDSQKPIHLYIQSPGGAVYSGFAIYDTMKMISAPVATYAIGFTGSMATFLLSSGEKGMRHALSHATIHMHPSGGGAKGYTEDVMIAAHEQERIQTQIFHIMGQNTGHAWKEIETFFLRDKYLNVLEAKEFGFIDEIMGEVKDLIHLERKIPSIKVAS